MFIKDLKKKLGAKNYNLLLISTFLLGVLLIAATYAWFSSTLNTKVKIINLVVSNDSGLSISFDGINFGSSIQISKENILDNLHGIYPNNTNQWPSSGLVPVSTIGIRNNNSDKFDIYETVDSGYRDRLRLKPYIITKRVNESTPGTDNKFVAFDIFLRNKTGSPISDNLYLDSGTGIKIEKGTGDEVESLLNSTRIGFLKIGSVGLKDSVYNIQNVGCNNACESIIYEPYSTSHNEYSISIAKKYNVTLLNGQYYPTYAMINESQYTNLKDTIQGQNDNFQLQVNRVGMERPLFAIPDGITKVRVYIWIEGQDIDSLDTLSAGSDISITINFVKDTAGYDYYNE